MEGNPLIMSDNPNNNDKPIVKHDHYETSLAARIVGMLFMPRPPKEEGGDPRPPLLDMKEATLILGTLIVFGVIIVALASSGGSVISSINLNK